VDLIASSKIYPVIIPRTFHLGLNTNITSGIDYVFNLDFDAVIVLEDDLLIRDNGLGWLVQKLDEYKNMYIGSISLYSNKKQEFQSWAWATYKKIWDKHKYIEGAGTQAQQFHKFHKVNSLICVTPEKDKVKHIGWKGEHFRFLDIFSIRGFWRKHTK